VRAAFIRKLIELARRDERIVLLTADLGYSVIEPFAEAFPERYFNVGVSEQNMVGMSTGLAEAGYVPFLYSIATFASLRPFEFFRNGPVLHRLPVRLIGVGGGFEYGPSGPTHFAVEDVGVMRTQPGLAIIAPADFEQAATALEATWSWSGPIYYRLGKNDRDRVPGLEGRFEADRAQVVREGDRVLLLALGNAAFETVAAAERLAQSGTNAAVVVVACARPAPLEHLASLLSRHTLAATVENHYLDGGLGSLLCELVAERGIDCRVLRCGVSLQVDGVTGSEGFLNARYGLDAAGIAERVTDALASVGAARRARFRPRGIGGR
jgi:transketolase